MAISGGIYSLKHTIFAAYYPIFHYFTIMVANDSLLLGKTGTCHKLTPGSSWQPQAQIYQLEYILVFSLKIYMYF